ncbi:MAG: hypothetical protein EOP46_14505 [Sphingobacteriaceae bacterium]|nr:MAG: hypothetical protein EOP46_14505 [Sphingobacteriaceae bacterium]
MAAETLDIQAPVKSKVTEFERPAASVWSGWRKFAFRASFIYLLFLCLPIDPDVYEYIAKMDITQLNCRDLFIIATYHTPDVITLDTESFKWGIAGYLNIVLPFLAALPLAGIWSLFDKSRREYTKLSYWIEVIVRYRVAIGLIAWGYRKLLPGQMVLPTLTILNTPFADLQAQKHYWQSVGIVPGYEVFLGAAEFIAGFLLLFRKTSAFGAALTAVLMFNVALANHAYDGSVHIHSAVYAVLATFLVWNYLPKIWDLLYKQKDTVVIKYYPAFSAGWLRYTRIGIKTAVFGVFVASFFVLQVIDYREVPYRLPVTPGITGLTGRYEVTEFKLNDKTLPYNPLDSVRWQEAIFEKWSTLTFKVNSAASPDRSNGGGYSKKDMERKWEIAGIGGGRRWYYYKADTVSQTIYLQNKNNSHCGDKNALNYKQQYGNKIAESSSEGCDQTFSFHYQKVGDTRVILNGIDQDNQKLYIVLDRADKYYTVLPGNSQPILQ